MMIHGPWSNDGGLFVLMRCLYGPGTEKKGPQ